VFGKEQEPEDAKT